MPVIKDKISKLRDSVNQIEEKKIDLSKKIDTAKTFYNFSERKESYYRSAFEGNLNDLRKADRKSVV